MSEPPDLPPPNDQPPLPDIPPPNSSPLPEIPLAAEPAASPSLPTSLPPEASPPSVPARWHLYDPYVPPPRRELVVWGAIGAFVVANVLSFVVITVAGYSGKSDEVLSPPVFFLSLLSVSGTFALLSLLFARGAPEGLAQRLLLVRPNIPPRLLWLLLPATWGVWIAGAPLSYLGNWLFGDSDSLLNFTGSYSTAPWSWKIAFLAASTLGPGFGEELLFRGWLQNGLVRSRGARFALVITAFAFAACHLPPARVLFIIPLAFWLGWLPLRTGSLFPGILCHVFVNLTGHLLLATDFNSVFVFSAAFFIGVPAFFIVVRLLRQLRREAPPLAAASPIPGQVPASSMPRDDA